MLYLEKPEQFANPMEIVGCFVECAGKILLLERQDHKEHGGHFGPPGGKVEKTDTSLPYAISREVQEETGLFFSPENIEYIIPFYVCYPDGRNFIYHQYRIILGEIPQIELSSNEHKGYRWVSPEEALLLPLIHDEEYCIQHVYPRQ